MKVDHHMFLLCMIVMISCLNKEQYIFVFKGIYSLHYID